MKQSFLFQNLLAAVVLLISLGDVHAQGKDPFRVVKPLNEHFQPLRFGEIRPTGWLKKQVTENLDGFTGRLDSLVPALITNDDIYGKQRLTRKVKSKDVGAVSDQGDWQVQFLWWNSETQSNWWDGYIRSAILTEDAHHLTRVKNYINKILATQDADGYLGIYDKELRYKFDNENGELWSKATLLRGLLAWYEYTKEPKVLRAVQRAVQNVMDNWKLNASHPFYSINPYVGGLSHGLVFTDVLENLYRLTKQRAYLDYTIFCYKDFSLQVLNEDAQYQKLLDTSLLLKGHGVHTYEHLRTVAAAYYASGNPALQVALKNFLQKIVYTTSGSGGPVGDEWIGGRKADATKRGYEYCSIHELLHSYGELLIKTGDDQYGDKIEKLFFNAAQGARHPEKSCIGYLKSDNAYSLTGSLNNDTADKKQTRYKYSPVHQDAAVCCVPNAGRIAPYYIQQMWMKEGDAIVASLLGPCNLSTTINGKKLVIGEETGYPFQNKIRFKMLSAPGTVTLKIRKPAWAKKFKLSHAYRLENDYLVLRQQWKANEVIELEFFPEPRLEQDQQKAFYWSYGPLVLAHPVEAIETKGKAFPLPGFYELTYQPVNLVVYKYSNHPLNPIEGKPGSFQTLFFNPITQQDEPVTLRPMGETILRQVSFDSK